MTGQIKLDEQDRPFCATCGAWSGCCEHTSPDVPAPDVAKAEPDAEMVEVALSTWFEEYVTGEVNAVGGFQGHSIDALRSRMRATIVAIAPRLAADTWEAAAKIAAEHEHFCKTRNSNVFVSEEFDAGRADAAGWIAAALRQRGQEGAKE